MITVISNVISLITKYSKLLAVIIILILSAIFVLLRNQLRNKDKEIDRLLNNIEYYLSKDSAVQRILSLSKEEYKHTKDSLIQEIKSVLKRLKISNKEVLLAQLLELVIKYDTTLVIKESNFYTEIKPNKLTSIIINKLDSLLTTSIDIRNTQTLIVTNRKQYKRQYKNWFTRLLHFDFKKVNIRDYQINNSNELIKVDKTILVEIPD